MSFRKVVMITINSNNNNSNNNDDNELGGTLGMLGWGWGAFGQLLNPLGLVGGSPLA